ncbi:MAG TPA: LysR substrate-binding domain-containing protein [Rhodopila sp.]|uniref:LysR substrate-binding domain-containing protein n=1 Tax=Rhodopila sp. TaxID=2480087 RepID=UPI002C337BE3|nr:LysR substrate-binding domain-containing protein [Rhodopila sp.]HVY18287.1 LysR substrate-binding domain-containing protein [Rhodopila sp.]
MPTPSLRALRALAETARAGSLAGAARAMNITPSAVSHLLRDLDLALEVSLFAGKGRLTETGEHLARRLTAAFDTIDGAVQEAHRASADIRVSTLSSFLTLWLVPRLGRFQAAHPRTHLLLSTGTRPVDLATEPFDCAIRWGRGGWPGLRATLLFPERPVVVLNPRLLRSDTPAHDLPRLAGRTRPDDWPLLAHALGWSDRPPLMTLETRALAVQAAIAGMGAAVVDRNLVADLVGTGVLTEIAPPDPIRTGEGHWFVTLPERLRQRPIRRFRDWLAQETQPDHGDAEGLPPSSAQGPATQVHVTPRARRK